MALVSLAPALDTELVGCKLVVDTADAEDTVAAVDTSAQPDKHIAGKVVLVHSNVVEVSVVVVVLVNSVALSVGQSSPTTSQFFASDLLVRCNCPCLYMVCKVVAVALPFHTYGLVQTCLLPAPLAIKATKPCTNLQRNTTCTSDQ